MYRGRGEVSSLVFSFAEDAEYQNCFLSFSGKKSFSSLCRCIKKLGPQTLHQSVTYSSDGNVNIELTQQYTLPLVGITTIVPSLITLEINPDGKVERMVDHMWFQDPL